MDFSVDEEFDYEEDEFMCKSLMIDSVSKNSVENGKSKNANLTSCDEDCLQINCSEEDENLVMSEGPSEKEESKINSVESQNCEKDNNETRAENENFTTREKTYKRYRQNNFNFKNRNGFRYRFRKFKKKKPFFRRPVIKRNFKKFPGPYPWLSAFNFLDSNDIMKLSTVVLTNEQLLHSFRDNILARKVNFDAFQNNQPNFKLPIGNAYGNLPQQWSMRPLISDTRTSFNDNVLKLNVNDNKINFSKPFRFSSHEGNIFSSNNEVQNCSAVAQNRNAIPRQNQDFGETFRLNEAQNSHENNSKGFWSYVQNGHVVHCKDFLGKCEAPKTNSLLSDENKQSFVLGTLGHDEKELVKLKKEARLQRFMSDDIVRKEIKPFETNVMGTDKGTCNSAHLRLGCNIQENESQRPSGKFFAREGLQRTNQHFNFENGCLPGKPNLSKEQLLKKQNPFESNSKIQWNHSVGTNREREVGWNKNSDVGDVKFSLTKGVTIGTQFEGIDERTKLFAVKKDADSPVQFVRTISKSLDELGFRKLKTGVVPETFDQHSLKAKPFLLIDQEAGHQQVRTWFRSFGAKNYPPSVMNVWRYFKFETILWITSQLTGCIVKVLNVPPSITVDEVLVMCSRVGAVKEVKLNFPKENSVVIRFNDPSEAENFYKLYHGREMNNCFLNVIVI